MSTISLSCDSCSTDFEKPVKDYNARLRKGATDFYCSLSCSSSSRNNVTRIREYHDNRRDEFTGLREHLRRARQRKGKFEGLTLDHLLVVWERQRGRCVYTGVELEHPGCQGHEVSKNFLASLDRIDSSVGYRDGNVQFVSATANHLKNDMTDREVEQFFDIVRGIR